MIECTYSAQDNKCRIRSTERLDRPTYDRVKAAGFSWAPKQGLFVAPMWTPEREDLALELADSGEIDDEDTTLAERAEERAGRFEGYQEKRADDAERQHEHVQALAQELPLGQPIAAGNWRAARRAEKDAHRIQNGMAKAVHLWETSEYWERRAKGAIRHAKYKELPGVRARRIAGLEADERKHQRGREEAMAHLRMWATLQEGPAEEGQPSPALRRALLLANHRTGTDRWYDLDNGTMSPAEVQAEVLVSQPLVIERHERWLGHIARRLTYERTLLAADGYVAPVKERLKRDLGPICNWPAPEAVHMTKAEMKARYHYMGHYGGPRGRRTTPGQAAYRQYTVNRSGGTLSLPVFLTDVKRKDPPVAPIAERVDLPLEEVAS